MIDRLTTRRWVLLGGAAIVAGLAIREYRLTPEDFEGGKLSVTEAHAQARSGGVTLIDIRRPDEWSRTGIPEGAHPLDMRRPDFVEALINVAGPDRSQPIALICARGVRSARLSNALSQAGFSTIIDVPEGMLGSYAGPGWLKTGLPVTIYDGETG